MNLLKRLRINSKGCEYTQKVANLLKWLRIYSKGCEFTEKVANLDPMFRTVRTIAMASCRFAAIQLYMIDVQLEVLFYFALLLKI